MRFSQTKFKLFLWITSTKGFVFNCRNKDIFFIAKISKRMDLGSVCMHVCFYVREFVHFANCLSVC